MTNVEYRDLLNRMVSDIDALTKFWADKQTDTVTTCLLDSLPEQRQYLVDILDTLV